MILGIFALRENRINIMLTNEIIKSKQTNQGYFKVIYPKYSKHWTFTVAYTIDWVCSKMLNHE